jgi:translation initiation factor IF-3
MRISHKKRPQKSLIPFFRRNELILSPEVRVLDAMGENVGVFKTSEALRMAREQEMDLVEINPKAEPPVAKIIDYTAFKYQKEKEARKQKAKAHVSEIKGVRLSIGIGEHDMEIRQHQSEEFLDRGDKVKVEIILKGREHGRPNLAREVITRFIQMIEKARPLRIEQEIMFQGGKMTAIVTKK